MSEDETTLADLSAARKRFLSLVEDIRPDLHRYCARMVGSVMDGEDIVQEALARAYYELSALKQPPCPFEPGFFRLPITARWTTSVGMTTACVSRSTLHSISPPTRR